MRKVKIIYWVSGTDFNTINDSVFIEMPLEEVSNANFDMLAMNRFRTFAKDNSLQWKEVTNIIKH